MDFFISVCEYAFVRHVVVEKVDVHHDANLVCTYAKQLQHFLPISSIESWDKEADTTKVLVRSMENTLRELSYVKVLFCDIVHAHVFRRHSLLPQRVTSLGQYPGVSTSLAYTFGFPLRFII